MNDRVEVYWNLHKKKWSVRVNGKVEGRHHESVVINDAKFVVQPAGRARVLKEKRKNVHAFVRGTWSHELPLLDSRFIRIRYNPYKYATFIDLDEKPIYTAKRVVLWFDGCCYALVK